MATVTPTTMRKLLNDPEQIVKDSLVGLAAAHGDILRVDAEAQVVVRAGAPRAGKVAPVSGSSGNWLTSSRPSTRTCSPRMRCSSASFLALRLANSTRLTTWRPDEALATAPACGPPPGTTGGPAAARRARRAAAR